jgi:hypothetical protein
MENQLTGRIVGAAIKVSAKFHFPFPENSSVPARGVGVLIFQGLFMRTKNIFLLFATGLNFHSSFPN